MSRGNYGQGTHRRWLLGGGDMCHASPNRGEHGVVGAVVTTTSGGNVYGSVVMGQM